MAEPCYTEHEKLSALDGANETIGQFIEWMQQEKGWTITRWTEAGNNGEPRLRWKDGITTRKQFRNRPILPDDVPNNIDEYNGDAESNPDYDSWSSGYVPVHLSIADILADYFGIDTVALDKEKRAMLDAIRRNAK